MAQSRQCMRCKYRGRLHSGTIVSYETDICCDHFLITGELKDKGADKNNCLLFEQKTRKRNTKLY